MDDPKGSPVDELVKQCLLQERGGQTEFTHATGSTAYTLRWRTHNALGLVFVAVYQKILRLDYVDDLLDAVRRAFADDVFRKSDVAEVNYDEEFTETFNETLKRIEAESSRRKNLKTAPKAFDAVKKARERNDASGAARRDGDDADRRREADPEKSSLRASSVLPDASDRPSANAAFDMSKIKKSLRSKSAHKSSSGNLAAKAGEDDAGERDGKPREKKEKPKRVWALENAKGKTAGLDFSEGKPSEELKGEDDQRVDITRPSRLDEEEDEEFSSEDEDEEDFESSVSSASVRTRTASSGGDATKKTKKNTFFFSLLQNPLVRNVVGKQSLERADLVPILENLKTNFMNKNVAEDIAEKLCESVASSMIGKQLKSFSSLGTMTKLAMEEALTRILTPKRSIDVLRDVRRAKEAGRPYVITFVGVNGVGKSTNLSKVAYWLLQHDCSPMIAACDTFRAGAVEQLRTHCKRLGVPLFERGYEKDPANVASEAIKAATRQKCDVVLVDTAGRMQDNEPLMRALAKLINQNEPDLVLFVGEALVGNDAVDQLSKFNERLSDLSSVQNKTHLIDGIVLSKFDTIDDKVGAALSMVYVSGAPVMFVGCGQTYTDLRRLNVKSVVKMLLSK